MRAGAKKTTSIKCNKSKKTVPPPKNGGGTVYTVYTVIHTFGYRSFGGKDAAIDNFDIRILAAGGYDIIFIFYGFGLNGLQFLTVKDVVAVKYDIFQFGGNGTCLIFYKTFRFGPESIELDGVLRFDSEIFFG